MHKSQFIINCNEILRKLIRRKWISAKVEFGESGFRRKWNSAKVEIRISTRRNSTRRKWNSAKVEIPFQEILKFGGFPNLPFPICLSKNFFNIKKAFFIKEKKFLKFPICLSCLLKFPICHSCLSI